MKEDEMNESFPQCGAFMAVRLAENKDRNGLHMEYRDPDGTVFARIAKVYKKKGLFGLFNQDSNVHGEVKDAAGSLLLTTTSYWANTKRGCKVDINNPDGTLLSVLYDANWGADFELPDGTVVGKARRPVRPDPEPATEPTEVVHTFTDASEQVVGSCNRHYLPVSKEERDGVMELLTLSVQTGMPVQTVMLDAPVDPVLRTFQFLFPALQNLRFARSG